ncbi:unnamed protein product, partial [Allacma fusca]
QVRAPNQDQGVTINLLLNFPRIEDHKAQPQWKPQVKKQIDQCVGWNYDYDTQLMEIPVYLP